MKSGYSSAGDSHEQDRKQSAQAFILKSGICRKIHSRVGENQPENSTGDHSHEHECGHVISRLHDKPHGEHSSEEDIDESNVDPCLFSKNQRKIHAAYKRKKCEGKSENDFFPAAEFHFMLNQSEDCCEKDEK